MTEKILFVDDEPPVLDGYKRMLYKDFKVETAVGGEQGLAAIQEHGPFAVVISDMRMPGMNGAEFLAQVRQKVPDTVRMLLTGYADLNAAIDAVNRGNIFRFLTKPCEKDVLAGAIHLGVEQYRSVTAEKELAQKGQILERTTAEWDQVEICQWDNFEGPTGLGGPTQARKQLAPLFGVDSQCYVVLLKLSMVPTIEQRYGDEAAADYLSFVAQFLIKSLRSDDRLYHWGRDVLMAIARRQVSLAALRMEIDRLTLASRSYLMESNGKSVMIACPITFDLLPISQFATLPQMLAAFDANLIVKV